jgi:predicted Zn finger-like uncharacterized protein
MFKVVTDQLKVSQGWVRCGHCAEVFDASLHLQATQQTPTPLSIQPPAPVFTPESVVEPPDSEWSPGVFFADGHVLAPSEIADATEQQPHQSRQPLMHDPDGLRVEEHSEAVRAELAQAQAGNEEGLNARADSAAHGEHKDDSYDSDVLSEFPLDASNDAKDVSFVRDARRRALWRKPAVRVALGLFGIVLVALLVLQVLVQYRDSLAAFEPAFKPWVQKLCDQLHCEVAPLRKMESLVIDSSSFNKGSADSYRLTFTLKNSSAVAVAMPSLEVTLTDTQDQALVRRVLTPVQFGSTNGLLGAGADFAGAVVMQVLGADTPAASTPQGPLRVAGYRVLIFYP